MVLVSVGVGVGSVGCGGGVVRVGGGSGVSSSCWWCFPVSARLLVDDVRDGTDLEMVRWCRYLRCVEVGVGVMSLGRGW